MGEFMWDWWTKFWIKQSFYAAVRRDRRRHRRHRLYLEAYDELQEKK